MNDEKKAFLISRGLFRGKSRYSCLEFFNIKRKVSFVWCPTFDWRLVVFGATPVEVWPRKVSGSVLAAACSKAHTPILYRRRSLTVLGRLPVWPSLEYEISQFKVLLHPLPSPSCCRQLRNIRFYHKTARLGTSLCSLKLSLLYCVNKVW